MNLFVSAASYVCTGMPGDVRLCEYVPMHGIAYVNVSPCVRESVRGRLYVYVRYIDV